jgi:hypothetical protein
MPNAKLTVPTVHLNGTSKRSLIEQYVDASTSVGTAILFLEENGPNARDYYVQGSDVFTRAVAEHVARIQKLVEVQKELGQLVEAIDAQGKR